MTASSSLTLPDVMSAEEVAHLLDCSVDTVELEARQHRLPGLKFGRGWRFPREALLQELNRRAAQNLEAEKPQPRTGTVVMVPAAPQKSRRQPIPAL